MNKVVVLTALLSLFAATSAFAEHKLLVTAVPNPGSFEARLDASYSRAEFKNDLDEKLVDERSGAALTVAAGVIEGLKLSASLPYTFAQHAEGTSIDGFGDLTLGARYALTKSLVKLPFDAAFGIDWKLASASDKAGRPGTGRNDYAPYLAISKNHHVYIPYFKYQPEFIVKEHAGQTIHNLTLGTEIEFSHHYSLDVALKAALNNAHEGLKSSNDYEVEVAPYINLAKNIYLLPKVAYKFIGDIEDTAGTKLVKNAGEYTVGVGVYCLF
jgi:hypothetical protein